MVKALQAVRLLHIHAQPSWHDSARIAGNRDALTILRDAIDAALATGKASAECMTRDGEGFSAEIVLIDKPWEHAAWEVEPLPYIDPVCRGEPDPQWHITQLRQALRKANEHLVKRGVKPVADPTDMTRESSNA